MNNEIKYIPTKEAIIGYSDSSIAKTESNDCVVRAIASAFEMHYDEAHKLVAKIWFRKNREGTRNFTGGMHHMAQNEIQINGKLFSNLGDSKGNMKYDVKSKGQIIKRNMTTGTFIKKYPVGKYLVVVRGHAFSIINGQVVGNTGDATMKKRVILHAWKVS
jgi:hypothetical protein